MARVYGASSIGGWHDPSEVTISLCGLIKGLPVNTYTFNNAAEALNFATAIREMTNKAHVITMLQHQTRQVRDIAYIIMHSGFKHYPRIEGIQLNDNNIKLVPDVPSSS